MSKDGVYPSSIHFLSFMEDVEFEAAIQDQIMEVDITRSSIGEVRGVVQVFQNLFTGIPNPYRSSRL